MVFKTTYNGVDFEFESGSQAYIFQVGVCTEFDIRYGMDIMKEYVDFTFQCYLKAPCDVALGSLADFISENWEDVKDLGITKVINKFYIWGA